MKLIDQIAKKLEEKPLIFFCREVERAIGIEDLLQNYHICCIEDNYLVDVLIHDGHSVFCLEREGIVLEEKSVANLIKHSKTKEFIQEIAKSFYAMAFFASGPFEYAVKNLGGELLQPEFRLQTSIENKISQLEIFKKSNITYPKSVVVDTNQAEYSDLAHKLGNSFVLQKEKSHTGAGTFFIENEDDFKAVCENQHFKARCSEFITGETFTVNFVVGKVHTHIGAPQLQITNIPRLFSLKGATLGNDFSYAKETLTKKSLKQIDTTLHNLAATLRESGYIGMAGIDFILNEDVPVVLEINARQTANASFETQLEKTEDLQHLKIIAIAEALGIRTAQKKLHVLDGAQLFLRAEEELIVGTPEKLSGKYELNDSLFYYLLVQKEGQRKRATDELARVQIKQSMQKDDTIMEDLIDVLLQLF